MVYHSRFYNATDIEDSKGAGPMPEPTYEITVTSTYKITTEDLKDILATAFEGGINFWVEEVRLCGWEHRGPNHYVGPNGETAEYVHEIPALGGVVQIREEGEPCLWHNLTLDVVLRGISRMTAEGRINPSVEEWTTDVDANVACDIIQYGLLGELVYG